MQFRIEYVSSQSDRAYVLARQLEGGTFALSATPRLAGLPITARLSQPRAVRPDGSPDTGVFAFELALPADAAEFSENQVVELSA